MPPKDLRQDFRASNGHRGPVCNFHHARSTKPCDAAHTSAQYTFSKDVDFFTNSFSLAFCAFVSPHNDRLPNVINYPANYTISANAAASEFSLGRCAADAACLLVLLLRVASLFAPVLCCLRFLILLK
jgi:hypothetical protein